MAEVVAQYCQRKQCVIYRYRLPLVHRSGKPQLPIMDLTRFRGHLIGWEEAVHDADDTSILSIRFPGADA